MVIFVVGVPNSEIDTVSAWNKGANRLSTYANV